MQSVCPEKLNGPWIRLLASGQLLQLSFHAKDSWKKCCNLSCEDKLDQAMNHPYLQSSHLLYVEAGYCRFFLYLRPYLQSNHRAFSMLEQGIVVFFLALGTKFMRISFFNSSFYTGLHQAFCMLEQGIVCSLLYILPCTRQEVHFMLISICKQSEIYLSGEKWTK